MHYIRMSGNDVFKHAVRAMESVACEALEGGRDEAGGAGSSRAASGQLPHIDATARGWAFRWTRCS